MAIVNDSSERFIGNYNVTNCSKYQDNPLFSVTNSGDVSQNIADDTLVVGLLIRNNTDYVILVKKENKDSWLIIGELTLKETDRQWIIPILRSTGIEGGNFYSGESRFKVSITKCNLKEDIDNRLSISIWAK